MEKEKEIKKKKKLRWQIKLLIIIISLFLYMFFIGTKGLNIKEFKIYSDKIDSKTEEIKILQFSDLQYGSSVNFNDVKKLIKKINLTKPDIVLFTGDLIDKRYNLNNNEKNKLTKEFSKINSNLGNYYIKGIEDNNDNLEILDTANFISIIDNEKLIYKNSSTPILICSKTSCKKYLDEHKDNNYFTILAIHNPDYIDDYKDYKIDIALAGFTHSGQINIPKIRNLFIKTKYKEPVQKVNNTKLYINPGIGTTKLKVRLFNRPTIYLFRIEKDF